MLTDSEIEQLPQEDQAVTRCLHAYYRALLSGAPATQRRRLWQVWRAEIQRRWPDTFEEGPSNIERK